MMVTLSKQHRPLVLRKGRWYFYLFVQWGCSSLLGGIKVSVADGPKKYINPTPHPAPWPAFSIYSEASKENRVT